jgi:hypothetical protein
MKIVICGSRRFHDGIRKLEERLRADGHIVFGPILNRNKGINNLPDDLKRYAFIGLTHHHLLKHRNIYLRHFFPSMLSCFRT